MSRILDMQRLQSDIDSSLLATFTNHLLNMIISQVMLINRSRLATYANHAIVTHEVYEITFCHDYKIVNVIQVYTMQTITTSGVLRLNAANKPSSISEDVAKIRINSQHCKGNNPTTRHT
jgi:aspartate/tyrosine/aromatic aminotransferase